MTTRRQITTKHFFKPAFTTISVLALGFYTSLAAAQDNQQVSALGRLQPEGGVIRIGAPSTPESISGSILDKLFVKEGDYVEAGTLLAVTASAAVLTARVKQAQATQQTAIRASEAAQSQADESCVRADVASREADRRVRLLAQKLASEEETESALGQSEATAASCTAGKANALYAKSQVDVAAAGVEVAQAELERAYIKAPFSGRILDVLRHPGELIGLEGLLELGRVDRMYAVAEVYETDIKSVKVGQRATVTSDALPGPLGGKVELIRHKVRKQDVIGTDPAADKDARIIEVEILLDDPEAAASLTYLQVQIIIDARD
jgi:HlyD family secretion protein